MIQALNPARQLSPPLNGPSGPSNSGVSEQQSLRKRIRDIQENPSIDQKEKARMVQCLMCNDVRHASPTPSGPPQESNCSLTCQHYKKQCSRFHFDCCGITDPCHRCHLARGTCSVRPPLISKVTCNVCNTEQPPAKNCMNCQVEFGKSYCSICKIWTPLDITHCNDCGFCRVGKSHEVFHCYTCDACFGVEGKSGHRCARIQLKDAACPLCLESVHTAQKASNILPCGHVLHADCWKEAAQKGEFRCPTCRKSLFDMAQFWNSIRRSIELQPIPRGFFPIRVGDIVDSPYGKFLVTSKRTMPVSGERRQQEILCDGLLQDWKLSDGSYAKAVISEDKLTRNHTTKIVCYDCEKKSETPFHFLGLECKHCGGYNTCQM